MLGAVSLGVLASNWDAVKTRFEDTSGSGRDNMYAMLVEHWRKAEPQNLVFGFGINSVQRYTGMMYGSEDDRGPYAHSDWFQLMHDFGLVGIVLLGWLHAAFLVLIRRGFKMRNPVTPSLAMGYTILFLVNIYSGQLMSLTAIYCGLLLVCGALAISTARQTAPRGAENGQAETSVIALRSPSVREFQAGCAALSLGPSFDLRGKAAGARPISLRSAGVARGVAAVGMCLGIFKEFWHMHWQYIAACRELDVSYKLLDISGPDWLDIVDNSGCDAFLRARRSRAAFGSRCMTNVCGSLASCRDYLIFPEVESRSGSGKAREMHDWLAAKDIPHPRTWVFYSLQSGVEFAADLRASHRF